MLECKHGPIKCICVVSVPDMFFRFDFRPYILFWCPQLTTLDGVDVNSEERLVYFGRLAVKMVVMFGWCCCGDCRENSRTLFPPGRPYPFAVGEHHVLVHYLASIYPLVTSEVTVKMVTSLSES